jgi:hypothetical protein
MCLQRNIGTLSRNHCCRGKEISITYSECVSLGYPACKVHALYYVVMRGLSGCAIFFTLPQKAARFSEKCY